MRALLEILVFFGLSASVHLALWMPQQDAGQQSAGAGGNNSVTIAPVDETIAKMIETWEQPPDPIEQPVAPEFTPPPAENIKVTPPQTDSFERPTSEQNPAPDMAFAKPIMDAPPALPAPKVQKPKPSDIRPKPRRNIQKEQPKKLKKQHVRKQEKKREEPRKKVVRKKKVAKQDSDARAAQRAQGQGKRAAKGKRGNAQVSTQGRASQSTLKAQWGGQIKSRVASRAPRSNTRGSVKISVSVHKNGSLQSVSVLGSSGNARLDRLVTAAVRRIRSFPAAPKGYTKTVSTFSMTVSAR